jgi:hypothetical protein
MTLMMIINGLVDLKMMMNSEGNEKDDYMKREGGKKNFVKFL